MSDNPAPPSKNPLLQTLLAMVGQSNVITVHRPLVDFLDGSLEGAMLLGQLLYWTPRSVMGGWISKSDVELQNELCLSRYSVRSARKLLQDKLLIETKIKKFSGFPTLHYLVNLIELDKAWRMFIPRLSEIEQTVCLKSNKPGLSEIEQTLTETTTETTKQFTTTGSSIFQIYENEIGALTPLVADALQDALTLYHEQWITDAITEAVRNNKRNWKYCEAILKRWKEEGRTSAKKLTSKPTRLRSTQQKSNRQDIIRKAAHRA